MLASSVVLITSLTQAEVPAPLKRTTFSPTEVDGQLMERPSPE
jgi:hypothetical protein